MQFMALKGQESSAPANLFLRKVAAMVCPSPRTRDLDHVGTGRQRGPCGSHIDGACSGLTAMSLSPCVLAIFQGGIPDTFLVLPSHQAPGWHQAC